MKFTQKREGIKRMRDREKLTRSMNCRVEICSLSPIKTTKENKAKQDRRQWSESELCKIDFVVISNNYI